MITEVTLLLAHQDIETVGVIDPSSLDRQSLITLEAFVRWVYTLDGFILRRTGARNLRRAGVAEGIIMKIGWLAYT